METQEIQAKQQAELHTQLWAMANDLRGSRDALSLIHIEMCIRDRDEASLKQAIEEAGYTDKGIE